MEALYRIGRRDNGGPLLILSKLCVSQRISSPVRADGGCLRALLEPLAGDSADLSDLRCDCRPLRPVASPPLRPLSTAAGSLSLTSRFLASPEASSTMDLANAFRSVSGGRSGALGLDASQGGPFRDPLVALRLSGSVRYAHGVRGVAWRRPRRTRHSGRRVCVGRWRGRVARVRGEAALHVRRVVGVACRLRGFRAAADRVA